MTIPYLDLPYKHESINGIECILGARFEHSKDLSYIRYELDNMSRIIRIDRFELLKFLLTGIKPKLPRYEVLQLPGIRSSIVIKIYVADLNFNEIKSIYDTYRDIRKVKKQKRITDKQRKIIDIISEMGQPPEGKGTSDYYKQVLVKWNNNYPEEQYTSWQAIYKAYENLKEKINRI